jgi:hypothetical protein
MSVPSILKKESLDVWSRLLSVLILLRKHLVLSEEHDEDIKR